jgi:serine/threonine-protein kinase
MSSVYAATHRNGKRVAIKVLRSDRLDRSSTRRRFLREGHIANRVGHEGVVAVLDDHVSDDGTAFLIMELLEGMNVEQYCEERGGSLPPSEVLAIADAVLDILAVAHAQQIVHRDVKPSNLFLTSTGRLKLLDFGIASLREISGLVNATGDGVVLGTPGFMAPEQARGRRNDIDARTDLWGVGALMFRLLTGRLVYETESSNEYVVAAATQPAPSLASVTPSLDGGVAKVVDRALMSDAAARWHSAAEMQKAIRHECTHVAHCPVPLPPSRREAVTLEESHSVNGTSRELPHRPPRPQDDPAARGAPRLWPYLLSGGLGGCLLVAIFTMTHQAAPSPTAPPRVPDLSAAEAKASLVAIPGPVSSVGPPSLPVMPASHSNHEVVKTSSDTNKARVGVSRATPVRPIGTRLAPGDGVAPGPSATAQPRPIRLEDVLNERH